MTRAPRRGRSDNTSTAPYIPQKTLDDLATHHPPGTRHTAMVAIAMSLIGNGLTAEAVFAELRSSFRDHDIPDKEISDIIEWCQSANPTPSGRHGRKRIFQVNSQRPSPVYSVPKPPGSEQTPADVIAKLISGSEFGEPDWWKVSPIKPPEGFSEGAALLFSNLYLPTDEINLVKDYAVDAKGKASPKGAGKTLPRDEWIEGFAKSIPQSEAGCWFRPNPVTAKPSGEKGGVRDNDVTAFRFLMVESDGLSRDQQLSLYHVLHLPIAAIYTSGGPTSVHSLLKVDAQDATEFEAIAKRIYKTLEPLGFDPANKNPSRLSRLPGALRVIGAGEDGRQRLLYLNPNPDPLDFAKLEASAMPLVGSTTSTNPCPQAEPPPKSAEASPANDSKSGIIPPSLPPIKTLREMRVSVAAGDGLPDIIEGLLSVRSKMMLSGPSKARKSWTQLELAMAIAGGHEWLGFKTKKSSVLFIDGELHENWLVTRATMIANSRGFSEESFIDNLKLWSLRGQMISADHMINLIMDRLLAERPKAIFFDPIYKMYGTRDENKAGDMNDLFNEFERVCQAVGCAIIYTHHFAKGDATEKSALDRASGSGVFARDPDSLVYLTPPARPKANEKNNAAPPGYDFDVECRARGHKPIEGFRVKLHGAHFVRCGKVSQVKPGSYADRYGPILVKMPELFLTCGKAGAGAKDCPVMMWVAKACGVTASEAVKIFGALRNKERYNFLENPAVNVWRGREYTPED